ncbi:MAG: 4Fe-4S binding protein [Mailhella sp.]|nr:4Fe-4S binding protein [Mailhella sp.]
MDIRRYLDKSLALGQCLSWLWTVLVIVLLGAHFYRASEYGMVLCVAGVLGLRCSSAAWTRWAVGLFLLWGMLEWSVSACALAQTRMVMGAPWMRGAAILSAVAVVTGLTGGMAVRQASRLAGEQGAGDAFLKAAVFMAVFLSLFYVRKFVPLEMLLLERFFPGLGMAEIFLAAWYGSFAAGLLADRRKSRKVRTRLWLFFACLFFVQFALGLLGVSQMLLTGRLHVPIPAFILYGSVFRGSLNAMPFIVLISTLLLGSAWCSMLCYFGPFDALAAKGRTLRPLPRLLQGALCWGRPAVFALGVCAAFILKHIGMSTGTAVSLACAYAFLSLLAMAALSRRYGGMMHCAAFCPMGLIVSWLGRLSPWRLRVDSSSCDACGACESVCRWRAITPESRSRGKALPRCTLCRDCIGVCRKNALSLRCAGLAPEVSERIFVGMLASLHAIFLACAMV